MKPWIMALALLMGFTRLPAQSAAPSLKVLFIGNSLTGVNDVPALVQAMARLQGVELDYVELAPGGYAIEDHWSDGHQALLQTGDYDVLVLQQGPSTLPESQLNLRQWSITWADEARKYGTQPALYMIWPVRTQSGGFALVSQSYRNAAIAANAAIFPAGEAWEQALRLNPSLGLYSSDDLHATPTGSFLAAMVIARGLVSLDPARVPAIVGTVAVPASTLAVFKSVVAAMPAATLPGSELVPVTPPVSTPPAAAAPAPSPPPTSSGGGAPGLWFLFVLLALGAAKAGGRRKKAEVQN